MNKEQFFLMALMELGPYDFTGNPEGSATEEEMQYIDRYYALAQPYGFGLKEGASDGGSFKEYYEYWRKETWRMSSEAH